MGSQWRVTAMAMAALLFASLGVETEAQSGQLAGRFNSWTKNVRFSSTGLQLALDPTSAAGVGSKASFLFGEFGAWMKLPANDSAGTVTTFYMSSPGPKHCEFDFEFLGNRSQEPFLLHTNIYVDGVGGREQQSYLGFDPSAGFHYYNFQWNQDVLVFYVDNIPIRMFKDLRGVIPNFAYPSWKPMGVFLSIWDGSSWATQGGRVPINWESAPFVASYENFNLDGCEVKAHDRNSVTRCQGSRHAAAKTLGLDRVPEMMNAVRANRVIYNYCEDRRRYPIAPLECAHNAL